MMLRGLAATLALIALCTGIAGAASDITAQAQRLQTPPLIDGILQDACWQELTQYNNFRVLKTGEPAGAQTYFRVLYDEDALYFAAVCAEPDMEALVANLTRPDDTLWSDDCLELFIDASMRGQSYLHIIVNPNGAVYDAWMTNGGASADMDYQAGIEAAGSKDADSWQVEMRLPFAGLHLPKEVSSSWAFNVCREKKTAPAELTSWSPSLQEGFHHPETFGTLTDIKANLRSRLVTIDTPRLRDPYFEDSRLQAKLLIPYANWTGRDIAVRVKAVFADLEDGKSETDAYAVAERGRGTMVVPVTVVQPGFVDLQLEIRRRKPDRLLSRSRHPMTVRAQPVDITFIKPSYRDTIYASAPSSEIVCRLKVNVPRKLLRGAHLRATFNAGATELAVQRVRRLWPKGQAEVAFNSDIVPAGDYAVKVEVFSKDGELLAEGSRAIHKLKARAHEVIVDDEGRLRVDGRPFFPFGFMGAGPDERLARVGANTIHTYVAWYTHRDKDLNAWLDRAQDMGMKVVMYPYPGRVGFTGFRDKADLAQEDLRDISEFVGKYKEHPALLAWYLCDEPRGALWRANLEKVYHTVAAADPYHPCVALDNSASTLAKLQDAGDILWIDPYPGFARDGEPKEPLSMVGLALDDVKASLRRPKPVWIAPQAFSYAEWDKEREASERAPSLTEIRCMHYLSLLKGADGIIPYAWAYAQKHPSTLNTYLENIGPEMAILMPVLLEGEPIDRARVGAREPKADLSIKAWRHDNSLYIIVVNADPREHHIRAIVPGMGDSWLKVLAANRRIEASGNVLQDTLPAHGVRIYSTRKGLPSLLTLSQVERRIANDEESAEATW